MSERSSAVLIEDMREALQKIFVYTEGLSEKDFLSNEMVIDAVLRNFEVLGEAASKLPDGLKSEHNAIEWHKLIGIRNRPIHGYFGVSSAIVWQTISNDLV